MIFSVFHQSFRWETILSSEEQKQQYILSKVKNFQEAKRTAHQELISGLPGWDSEYDIINNNMT